MAEDDRESVKAFINPLNQFSSSILVLTNPEEELKQLKYMFMGYEYTSDGKLVKVGEPLMNEHGISQVIGMARAIVSQVTHMSNMEEKNIQGLMSYLADNLARVLMTSRLHFEIKSYEARDIIYFTTLTKSYICLRRALNEGERRFWKGSQQDITQRIESPKQQGLFKKLAGWD